MPKKKRPELTDEERAKRLRQAAREAEADERGEEFKRLFKQVVPARQTNKRPAR